MAPSMLMYFFLLHMECWNTLCVCSVLFSCSSTWVVMLRCLRVFCFFLFNIGSGIPLFLISTRFWSESLCSDIFASSGYIYVYLRCNSCLYSTVIVSLYVTVLQKYMRISFISFLLSIRYFCLPDLVVTRCSWADKPHLSAWQLLVCVGSGCCCSAAVLCWGFPVSVCLFEGTLLASCIPTCCVVQV